MGRYHQKRVLISKEFTFDAAHNLLRYDGKCENLHGHTYKLIVGFSGYTDNEIGMVMDFKDVKVTWQGIENMFDHAYLNNTLLSITSDAYDNTTAENMVVYLYRCFEKLLPEGVRVEFIRLYETPTSYAEARREWMEE